MDEHDLKQYQININGNRFAVASPYGEEHIREVERYLEEQMNEVRQQSDLTSPSQLALLLALNFADEILTLQKRFRTASADPATAVGQTPACRHQKGGGGWCCASEKSWVRKWMGRHGLAKIRCLDWKKLIKLNIS